jgi:hypothetical protein
MVRSNIWTPRLCNIYTFAFGHVHSSIATRNYIQPRRIEPDVNIKKVLHHWRAKKPKRGLRMNHETVGSFENVESVCKRATWRLTLVDPKGELERE